MTEYEVHHEMIAGRHSWDVEPPEMLGTVDIPDNAKAVDIKCKSMSPAVIGVTWLEPVSEP